MTMLGFICADEFSIPPVFIFPRKRMYSELFNKGPIGCLCLPSETGNVADFTPANIISAFASTGIEPFNRFAIADERYAPFLVTDRDCPIGNNLLIM